MRAKPYPSAGAGISAHAAKHWGSAYETNTVFVRSVAIVMMALAIFMAIYAAYSFYLRGEMLQCAPAIRGLLGHMLGQQLLSCTHSPGRARSLSCVRHRSRPCSWVVLWATSSCCGLGQGQDGWAL